MKSKHILIVMACMVAGYLCTMQFLRCEYRHEPEALSIYVARNLEDSALVEVAAADTIQFNIRHGADIPAGDYLLNKYPPMLVWSMLVVIMMCISFGAFPFFIGQARALAQKFNLPRQAIASAFLYAAVLIGAVMMGKYLTTGYFQPEDIINKFHILLKDAWSTKTIVLTTLFLQVPALMVIFLVGKCASRLTLPGGNDKDIDRAIGDLQYLQYVLKGALQVISVIVVFSVLTSGTLRESILTAVRIKSLDIFPIQATYVYGLTFTLFLGIVYIPSYIFLQQRAIELKEEIAIATGDLKKANEIFEKTPKTTALENLRLALTVMAPLLSSFLPQHLNMFN